MSEYWKSTPKYWCKHCSCYVRDTKLERSNHEATAKHQGALKRSLRNLHRDHEREERDKERAQREIARLNGVVGGASSSSASSLLGPSGPGTRSAPSTKLATPSESQLKTQREQLAALGVAIPSDFRPEMAMPGDWTVTSTRVIDDTDGQPIEGAESKNEGKATGVTRKRGDAEEEEHKEEEEAAMRGLFKKPRRWGRDSKIVPHEDEDEDLEALLSGTIPLKHQADHEPKVEKAEDPGDSPIKKEEEVVIKEEPDMESLGVAAAIKYPDELPNLDNSPTVKTEEGLGDGGVAAVVFKKRKPKGIRTK